MWNLKVQRVFKSLANTIKTDLNLLQMQFGFHRPFEPCLDASGFEALAFLEAIGRDSKIPYEECNTQLKSSTPPPQQTRRKAERVRSKSLTTLFTKANDCYDSKSCSSLHGRHSYPRPARPCECKEKSKQVATPRKTLRPHSTEVKTEPLKDQARVCECSKKSKRAATPRRTERPGSANFKANPPKARTASSVKNFIGSKNSAQRVHKSGKNMPAESRRKTVPGKNGENKAKKVKTIWALTRITVFDDTSQTYEIMKGSVKPQDPAPVDVRGIFVIGPPKSQA